MRSPTCILTVAFALLTSAAYGQSFQPCPQNLPKNIPGVGIQSLTPPRAGPGELIIVQGTGFDLLPAEAESWFFSDATGYTALGPLHVVGPNEAIALVPGHHLAQGSGWFGFHQTVREDCGWAIGMGGGWLAPPVTFDIDDPSPYPRPATHLAAVGVDEETIQLTWTDNAHDEDAFEVYYGYTRATTTTLLGAVASNKTAEPIDGLDADTEYCFEVRAVNGAGHLPVPDPAKACARTLPKPPEIGDMTVTNVPGIENVMCPGSYPVDVVAFRDTNGNGVVDPLGTDALAQEAPAYSVIDVYHDPVWRIFVANRYAAGADLVVMALHVDHCGPQRPQFVAFHIDSTTNRVVRAVAGDWRENTGPGQEQTGVVMYDIESFTGLPMVQGDRVYGDLSALVQFELDLSIAGSPISFLRGGAVRLDFSRFGVEVQDG